MKITIHPDYASFSSFIGQIPQLFHQGKGKVLHNGRNKVMILEHEGKQFVVKKFKKANFIQRMAYTLWRPTKAHRAYLYAQELKKRGIDTPHEIAYMEDYAWGFFHTGWFICEECTWPQAFGPLFEAEAFDKELASAVARHIAYMHQNGIFFGDLNLRNFLYNKEEDGHYQFAMVDTNRSHFSDTSLPLPLCIKNLQTVTHRRDLFAHIVQAYAKERGLYEKELQEPAIQQRDELDQRNARKKQMKQFLGIWVKKR
ncbi:MAG: hypothetical protein MJZ16_12655 [Bacteroidales bacterium]|nr:hypothetical protein [Bacteroidales bacterium]